MGTGPGAERQGQRDHLVRSISADTDVGLGRDHLVQLAAGAKALASPTEAYFEVANRCNSRCATCPITFGPHEAARQMSLDEFKSLVAGLPDLRRAVLQGVGEPLLNRDLGAMIAHLKSRGVHVVFNTNGALLTHRRQLELIGSGLDELRVSLDASTPETYLKIRGIPAFDRVVANVAAMVRIKRDVGAETPRLSFWMTGLRENLAELPGLIDIAGRVGVDEVYVQRLTFWGQGLATAEQSVYRDASDDVDEILAEAERRAAELDVRLRGAGAVTPREGLLDRRPEVQPWRGCSRPLRLIYVTAQGNALPCCIAPFTDAPYATYVLGNVLTDGVEAVWNGERYRRFRERLYSSDPPPSCRSCGTCWSL